MPEKQLDPNLYYQQDFIPLPQGEVPCTTVSATYRVEKDDFILRLKSLQHGDEYGQVFVYLSDAHFQHLFWHYVESTGISKEKNFNPAVRGESGSPYGFDIEKMANAMVGRICIAVLKHDTYQDKVKAVVKDFKPHFIGGELAKQPPFPLPVDGVASHGSAQSQVAAYMPPPEESEILLD